MFPGSSNSLDSTVWHFIGGSVSVVDSRMMQVDIEMFNGIYFIR